MQEEEDDEDDGDGDENITLNRRGSRSEGRINVTVQDRIAETDRIKKEAAAAAIASAACTSVSQPKGIFEGMCGVTLVTGDGDLKEKLGVGRHILRPRTANEMNRTATKPKPLTIAEHQPQQRSNSVDHGHTRDIDDVVSTIFLTDSSTISLPIASQTAYTSTAGASKYKTMPSPTRANTILPGANSLNEIFEEGTDVGSSDSATTTPRPVARHTHYVNNRTQSQGSSSSSTTSTTTSAQRRSKFHKTRTASCSSSDASDDDSENRKKRAHKIVDSTKPLPQRRDSHDDSSDSQDPGNAASSGGSATAGTATTCPIQQQSMVGPHDEPTKNGDTRQGGETNGRQKSGQQMGFRRHRAGRRRAGETRLRESQSLNRITEVQESEMPLSSLMQSAAAQTNASSVTATAVSTAPPANKPKGFSARLFQGFRRNETSSSAVTIGDPPRIPLQNVANDDVEMVLGVELAKALKVTETKSSSATKKLKMLGRYFQVSVSLNTFCLKQIIAW